MRRDRNGACKLAAQFGLPLARRRDPDSHTPHQYSAVWLHDARGARDNHTPPVQLLGADAERILEQRLPRRLSGHVCSTSANPAANPAATEHPVTHPLADPAPYQASKLPADHVSADVRVHRPHTVSRQLLLHCRQRLQSVWLLRWLQRRHGRYLPASLRGGTIHLIYPAHCPADQHADQHADQRADQPLESISTDDHPTDCPASCPAANHPPAHCPANKPSAHGPAAERWFDYRRCRDLGTDGVAHRVYDPT